LFDELSDAYSVLRIRRVKCDEEKPHCLRCRKGGRQCEGYNQAPSSSSKRQVITVYVPLISPSPSSFVGSNEIQFYHREIVTKLSGYFDSNFWETLVMQLCQTEPVIQHAVSALSAVYRDIDSKMLGYVYETREPTPLVLKELNTAMRCLSKRIEANPTSHLVPLVACLLFTCLEFIKGTVESAMVHIKSGFGILNASRQKYLASGRLSPVESIDGTMIENELVPVFDRLNLLCVLFGQGLPPIQRLQEDRDQFTSFKQVREQLIQTLDPAMRFVRSTGHKTHSKSLEFDDYAEFFKLQASLQQWYTQFEEFLSKLSPSERQESEHATDLLRIHHRTVSIWLDVAMQEGEYTFDSYTAGFQEIVELGSKLVTLSSSGTDSNQKLPNNFSFEMQVIAPLYFTALKCRVFPIRRRAIEILRAAPRREGLWNAHISAKIAERVIEREEQSIQADQTTFPDVRVDIWGVVPVESARVFSAGELPCKFGSHENVPLMPISSLPDRVYVTFQTKPLDEDGELLSYIEEILL
jgi:Fungal Zn(2)-Cys(6) binuclear cluster domain/Fungal specific transcription factor domain